jgi:carboxymethylenebutenolidase
VQSVFTLGFCFGGALSWRQSAAGHGLSGAVGFYGGPSRVRDVVSEMRAPLLLMVAGADFTPLEEFQRFDGELTEAGVPHKMVVYEGAPHSFFDRTFKEHEEAAADSWRQMLDFVKENTTPG